MSNTECRISNLNETAFLIFIGIALFNSFLLANPANALPTAGDINNLAERVELTTDTFMQETFGLRMRYEFSGEFPNPDDKENLQKLAERARNDLAEIARKQKQLKQQIEDYQGDDWDDRYGQTGLWRKLFADLYTTRLSRCEIDFYLALSSQQSQRNEILHKILSEIDSLSQTYKQFGPKLIKGKVLALLAQTDPAYKPLAIKELEAFKIYSDLSPIQAAIEEIKLVGSAEPNDLNALVRCLEQNRYTGGLELILQLAFLQSQYDPAGFEKTIGLFPETQDFLGTLILSDISSRIVQQKDLERISVFEAELAAQAAWKNKTKDHKMLLDYLSSIEKFRTPLILYVAAVAFADSSPTKAVNLLVKASSLQQLQKSDRLEIEACKIARQAARLAYNLFTQAPAGNKQRCQLALEAFENYCTMAGEKIDEELEYLYSIVLNDCGQVEKSEGLLKKIADRPVGNWRNRARLNLIVQAIQQNQFKNQNQRIELLKQLSNLIADCTGQNETISNIRVEAITIYCQMLLELKDEVSAQKVLDVLTEAETACNPNLNVFKSRALRLLARLDESADYLLRAIEPNCCEHTGETMELLSEIVDKIDRFQGDDPSFMENCKKLAQICYDCLDGQQKQRAGLFLVEISIFPATKMEKKLSEFEKLLDNLAKDGLSDDIDLLRCRARLLTEQGKFDEAAGLWTQVAKIRKGEMPEASQRSWKWWRAKFYELGCWAKCPQTEKKKVLHTIEVLENSFPDIPPLWAEKFSLLKQQCRGQLVGASK